MRFRLSTLIIFMAGALLLAGCAGSRGKDMVAATPAPVKTQRPTFTPAPTRPKATATVAAAPTATRPPATPTQLPASPTPVPPSPTPEKASFAVTSPGETNVRSGPGTGYGRIGAVQQGQTYEVTGKNADGSWWQFTFSGQPGWIAGTMVEPNAAAQKAQVIAIVAPPTAVPQPAAPPAAPVATKAPAPPPAPPVAFVRQGDEYRNADAPNFNVVTFWGRLGQTGGSAIGGGFKLKVSSPQGAGEVAFQDIWLVAYPTMGSAEFRYNAKLELPRAAGAFRAVVVDGAGKEVSDVITGNLIDLTHDAILTWWPR